MKNSGGEISISFRSSGTERLQHANPRVVLCRDYVICKFYFYKLIYSISKDIHNIYMVMFNEEAQSLSNILC